MDTKTVAEGISKADVDTFRVMMAHYREMEAAMKSLENRIGVIFRSTDAWEMRLEGLPMKSDEDLCFAMGILTEQD